MHGGFCCQEHAEAHEEESGDASRRKRAEGACLWCGEPLPLLARLKGERFCSPAHEQQHYRQQAEGILDRVRRYQRRGGGSRLRSETAKVTIRPRKNEADGGVWNEEWPLPRREEGWRGHPPSRPLLEPDPAWTHQGSVTRIGKLKAYRFWREGQSGSRRPPAPLWSHFAAEPLLPPKMTVQPEPGAVQRGGLAIGPVRDYHANHGADAMAMQPDSTPWRPATGADPSSASVRAAVAHSNSIDFRPRRAWGAIRVDREGPAVAAESLESWSEHPPAAGPLMRIGDRLVQPRAGVISRAMRSGDVSRAGAPSAATAGWMADAGAGTALRPELQAAAWRWPHGGSSTALVHGAPPKAVPPTVDVSVAHLLQASNQSTGGSAVKIGAGWAAREEKPERIGGMKEGFDSARLAPPWAAFPTRPAGVAGVGARTGRAFPLAAAAAPAVPAVWAGKAETPVSRSTGNLPATAFFAGRRPAGHPLLERPLPADVKEILKTAPLLKAAERPQQWLIRPETPMQEPRIWWVPRRSEDDARLRHAAALIADSTRVLGPSNGVRARAEAAWLAAGPDVRLATAAQEILFFDAKWFWPYGTYAFPAQSIAVAATGFPPAQLRLARPVVTLPAWSGHMGTAGIQRPLPCLKSATKCSAWESAQWAAATWQAAPRSGTAAVVESVETALLPVPGRWKPEAGAAWLSGPLRSASSIIELPGAGWIGHELGQPGMTERAGGMRAVVFGFSRQFVVQGPAQEKSRDARAGADRHPERLRLPHLVCRFPRMSPAAAIGRGGAGLPFFHSPEVL